MNSGLPEKLLLPEAYPHPVEHVDLVETLLSWVFLTGAYAYKVKKPVQFDYVDFSTLALRKHFCVEELRCNRAFAPELYIDVLPIIRASASDALSIGACDVCEDVQIVDFAVKMLEFDRGAQADRRLEEGRLTVEQLSQFGQTLAAQHAELARIDTPVDSVTPVMDNFATLRALASAEPVRTLLNELEQATGKDLDAARQAIARRHIEGFTRECHGDLHLQNMVLTEQGIRAFDCLEFDRSLRTIDIWCDAAFLVMDCSVRGRNDLAYAFIDGYLGRSGDYAGVMLLPLYARYRAMVRAKVTALQLEQSFQLCKLDKLQGYVEWACRHQRRTPGRLVVTCGVSGSGKSYWAAQLTPELPAIRLRSDVLRKQLHGVAYREDSHSPLAAGLYGSEQTRTVYEQLAALSTGLLRRGENVIVDCTNLESWQRQLFYSAADTAGSRCILLHMTAPEAVLKRRIEQRRVAGTDVSEADLQILEWQLSRAEPPSAAEPAILISTEHTSLQQILKALEPLRAGTT